MICARPGAAPWVSRNSCRPNTYKYAVDFDGDGRADIWRSVPDALASAAKQLVGKGWRHRRALGDRGARAGQRRLQHRRARDDTSRSAHGSKRGFVPAYGRKLAASGTYRYDGIAVAAGRELRPVVPRRRRTISFSRTTIFRISMCCSSGTSSDRISGGAAVRDAVEQECASSRPTDVETMQQRLDRARPLQGQDRRQGRHAHTRGARRISEEERT